MVNEVLKSQPLKKMVYLGVSYISGQDKYEAFYQKNVKQLLADYLKIDQSQIRLNNDAACFLNGEFFKNMLKGFDTAIGLTLGTGLGSASIANGKAYDADFWKATFKNGIVEDYISTRWFVKRFYELTGHSVKDVKELIENHNMDGSFHEMMKEFSKSLGDILLLMLKKYQAEMIIFGGNIAKANTFFMPHLKEKMKENGLADIPIKLSKLGENAALFGAAMLFVNTNEIINLS